ncbi:unnamed protein product [Triticum turgidum subsp. durum]|uniref:CREG-like beta-barrel domain-containing protein n=1 Tax=Triticum turgidum subsp. durum TaxID=4567 RepID=A0A9R0Z719_TRITD|nr:unnamed protein product [Triticum turgidum subsp. durum]
MTETHLWSITNSGTRMLILVPTYSTKIFIGQTAITTYIIPFIIEQPKAGDHGKIIPLAHRLFSVEGKADCNRNITAISSESHGIPYFYLTTLDPTARDALEDERTSFTLSEFPLGTCGKVDPENPTCAKLTLTGKLKVVDHKSPEAALAKAALFSKHPEMEGWPKNHHFEIFKLEIENIFLIDWFGGPKPISPSQYLDYGRDQGSVMFL